jgi:hypothetical protein
MKRQAYGFRDKEFFKLKILGIHQTQYALVGFPKRPKRQSAKWITPQPAGPALAKVFHFWSDSFG